MRSKGNFYIRMVDQRRTYECFVYRAIRCIRFSSNNEKLHNIVRNALQMQIQIVMEEAEFVESIRQAQQEPYRVRRIEAGDVMHLSQNVVETFIDRIEVFNDEHVKIHFTFENVLADYAE